MEKEESVDPERLLQCPYDKNHKIRSCRFPYHLVKCRKNHPDIAAKLATCPFNARHLVPRDQLSEHIATCMDKIFLEDEVDNIKMNEK
ncbi:gametocyte-specific factor 1-like isoform X1 [Dipodomys merriami]|uniref:gametocyte-specific factor 1-like isoform X1 n=1 Tax=Dipodomys merriami TaxID=94247 RepID=UPI00385609CE